MSDSPTPPGKERSSASRIRVTRAALPAMFGAVVEPIQAFFRLEAAGGIVLLACATAALAWANLGGIESYRAVFHFPISIGIGAAHFQLSVLELVNDGLMTIFFFVVGMEIKRELVEGELRTLPQALLPAIAALGGMLVPAAIFATMNRGGPGLRGWGIPMATDIAFSIGVLTVVGSHVPRGLLVFVTALAIFDDIGGIVVIAFFYGDGLHLGHLGLAALVTAGLLLMSRAYVRNGMAWAAGGALLWLALHHAGIHPTISGVVLGLAIPARPRRPLRDVISALARHSSMLAGKLEDEEIEAAEVLAIEETLEDVEAPLTRFVYALHPWVAFGIMPLFALANSGVHVGALDSSQLTGTVAVGTALALFFGKQIGIFSFSIAAVKFGVAAFPKGSSISKLLGASIVAGIGFTVALFIATLAFPDAPHLLDQAKVGILVGSLAAGAIGAAVLRMTAPVTDAPTSELPGTPARS